ncbi:MAG: phosphatidate cytidylyltransferase [Rubricoccaceae bacterium]
MSNLAQRVLTALVGAPLVFGALWAGGWTLAGVLVFVALTAQAELYRLFRGARPLVAPGLALGAVAVLRPMLPFADALLAAGALLVLVATLYRASATPLADAAATLFGVLYPAALLGAALALRSAEAPWLFGHEAFWLTLAGLVCVWAADSFAYFAGRTLGRRALFPRVSPSKTWEGSAGGVVGALALAATFKLGVLPGVLSWPDVLALGLICGGASQFGDLVESHFKRAAGVKDSGRWIPGHGGMLDRVDALLFALPLLVLYFEVTRGL